MESADEVNKEYIRTPSYFFSKEEMKESLSEVFPVSLTESSSIAEKSAKLIPALSVPSYIPFSNFSGILKPRTFVKYLRVLSRSCTITVAPLIPNPPPSNRVLTVSFSGKEVQDEMNAQRISDAVRKFDVTGVSFFEKKFVLLQN